MRRCYLFLDMNNLCHRQFHQPALKTLTRANGQPSGVFFGTLISVAKLIERFKPYTIVAVFDGEQSREWRRRKDKSYKEGRKEHHQSLYTQMRAAKRCLETLGVRTLQIASEEADDCLWHCAKYIGDHNTHHADHQWIGVIVTEDHDLLQAVTRSVSVYNDQRQKMWGPNAIAARYHLDATQLPMRKALVGKTLELKGVPGIGEKRALQLIQKYKTANVLQKKLLPTQQKIFDQGLALSKIQLNPETEHAVRHTFKRKKRAKFKRAKRLLKKYACHSLLLRFDHWSKPFQRLH